jgi:bacteriorhodopsin|tara:strand:- start:640 stop:1326 length:687 start_codon:yes stop_codon:yes gene_type:complete
MMNLVEKYLGENKDELVKMTFYITYVFLLTTATITFIEAMRTKDAKIRNILNLETCISVVAAYFYGKFVNDIEKEGVNYKKINLTRYTDWYITTPIMLLVLVLALLYNTGGRLNFFTFLKILVLNFTMLTFGYLGETGAISKMNGQIFGFAAFFALYGFIYKTFLSKKYIFDNSILYWSFVIFWSGYGLLYFAEDQLKNSGFNMLDLFAKCFVGIFFWAYFTKVFTLK